MKKNPIFTWAAIVFGFWWLIFSYFSNVVGLWLFDDAVPRVGPVAEDVDLQRKIWALGIAIAISGVIGGSIIIRQARDARLQRRGERGMWSTLGAVPIDAPWFEPVLESARKKPSDGLALPDVPPAHRAYWAAWQKKYRKTHPQHVALARAVMAIYEARKELPATHHAQGHGNLSLGVHCLSVACAMDERAKAFHFDGLRNKKGVMVAPLHNASGVDLTAHPLVFIAGLAHDIGKIDGFLFEEGKLVGCLKEHDMLGARMVGRIREAWDLPERDRCALLVAIGFYHHPLDFPLDKQGRLSDDLGAALMTLLHDVDIEVSGDELDDEYGTKDMDELSVYEAFVDLISEVGRVNGTDKSNSVGQHFGDYSVFKEDQLRREMALLLNMSPTERTADGSEFQVTRLLSEALVEKGLATPGGVVQTVKFLRDGNYISEWAKAIVIRPEKILPGLRSMDHYSPGMTLELSAFGGSTASPVMTEEALVEQMVNEGKGAEELAKALEDLQKAKGGAAAPATTADTAEPTSKAPGVTPPPTPPRPPRAEAPVPAGTTGKNSSLNPYEQALADEKERERLKAEAREARKAAQKEATAQVAMAQSETRVDSPAAPAVTTPPAAPTPARAESVTVPKGTGQQDTPGKAPATAGTQAATPPKWSGVLDASSIRVPAAAPGASLLDAFERSLFGGDAGRPAAVPSPALDTAPPVPVTTATDQEPLRPSIPRGFAKGVNEGTLKVVARGGGAILSVDVTGRQEWSQWLAALPEGVAPDPVCVKEAGGRLWVLLAADWQARTRVRK